MTSKRSGRATDSAAPSMRARLPRSREHVVSPHFSSWVSVSSFPGWFVASRPSRFSWFRHDPRQKTRGSVPFTWIDLCLMWSCCRAHAPCKSPGESESRPSLLLVIAVFTLPAFVASLTLGQDPVYNTALLADRVWTFCASCAIWLRDKCFLASIAIFAVWALGVLPGGPNYWWIWQLQSRIFNWDSCAGLTVCYDEHGRPCQWVAPLAKEYCAPLGELYG